MTYEDLINERNDYIEKLKEVYKDDSTCAIGTRIEYYAAIRTIDKFLLKYFNVELKFDILEVLKSK